MHQATSTPVIVSTDWDVSQGLHKLGLTREDVREIAIAAASARAEALAVDPRGTAGMLSYIHGVRAKRLTLVPRGWKDSRVGNVESTINHDIGVQLCFQNVDRACSDAEPQAISGKGAASRNLVNAAQGELFNNGTETKIISIGKLPSVWFICVSVDEESVRAEVSYPKPFDGNQFCGFVKRIFVLSESFDPKTSSRKDQDDDDLDFDVVISKK